MCVWLSKYSKNKHSEINRSELMQDENSIHISENDKKISFFLAENESWLSKDFK